jgi:Meiotically up-regulated gene 113
MDKQHILKEIKRTAQANGDKPLGMDKFYGETGIKRSDWLGKYWARWGDALQECGFEPNQLKGALDEQTLIEKFIELMRELGKFPTDSEVKLKTHAAPGFPWPVTFARLGSKKDLARRIQKHCKEKEGYSDIVALCAPFAETLRTVSARNEVDSEANFGFVYLMKSGRYYKIGRTNHIGGRERDLSIQLPDKVKAVHSIRTDDPVGIEAYWHNRFEPKRKNGEWFDLSNADVTAFKRRKFM